MTTRLHDNSFKAILLIVLFIILMLKTFIAEAQMYKGKNPKSSIESTAGATDLYESNISVNFYPLSWITTKSFVTEPYITGSMSYDRFKYFIHLFSEVRYGRSLSSSTNNTAFSQTQLYNQTQVTEGASFGAHR